MRRRKRHLLERLVDNHYNVVPAAGPDSVCSARLRAIVQGLQKGLGMVLFASGKSLCLTLRDNDKQDVDDLSN